VVSAQPSSNAFKLLSPVSVLVFVSISRTLLSCVVLLSEGMAVSPSGFFGSTAVKDSFSTISDCCSTATVTATESLSSLIGLVFGESALEELPFSSFLSSPFSSVISMIGAIPLAVSGSFSTVSGEAKPSGGVDLCSESRDSGCSHVVSPVIVL